jgi:hypothetical protein
VDSYALPSRPQIAHRQERPGTPIEELERYCGSAYSASLYANPPETAMATSIPTHSKPDGTRG